MNYEKNGSADLEGMTGCNPASSLKRGAFYKLHAHRGLFARLNYLTLFFSQHLKQMRTAIYIVTRQYRDKNES